MNLAAQEFQTFLNSHVSEVSNFTNVPLEETGLAHDFYQYPLRLTHFEDLYDTLMYSKLIQKSLEFGDKGSILIDMGAGSSIPSLLAAKASSIKPAKIIAVDIDEGAREAGHYNAKELGLENIYTFLKMPIEEVLSSSLVAETPLIIVSNPPYIATPYLPDPRFVAVDGGKDGAKFMLKILQQKYPRGTILALLWGSLTYPADVLRVIKREYDVMDVQAMKIHFGKYTSHPVLKDYLYKLRDQGKVFFAGEQNNEEQIVIGTVLKKK